MNETSQADLVTVFVTSDRTAELDAGAVRTLLMQNGIEAILCDDTTAGVSAGTWEVRVPYSDLSQAESLVTAAQPEDSDTPDPSEELDSVTLTELQGTTGEIEAMGIKTILDANGIPNFLVGSSTLPNLSFQIQVPATEVARAQAVLAEARAAGPAAAIEAERETESGNASVL